jgi:AraC family transcriptional regulator
MERAPSARPWAGIELHEAAMAPGLRLRSHAHARAHVCVVLSGDFRERVPGGTVRCAPGTLRFSPAGAGHELVFGDEGARCLLLELDEPLVPARRFPALARGVFRSEPVLAALAARLRAARASPAGRADPEGTVLELLARAALPEPEDEPDWLREAHARVQRGPVASVDRLADSLGVHRGHLARWHRRYYGRSLREELATRRLLRALELVCASETPLAEVALRAGFFDQSQMTRLFARRFGVTPSTCRREQRAAQGRATRT